MYNHTNSKKKFNSREIYLQELSDSGKYSNDKIFLLSDSELSLLVNDIVGKHLSTYYGIADGNSFVSADQLTVKSCQGQIAILYHHFKKKDNTIVIDDASTVGVLKSLKLDSSKQTVIFLYSYKLGRLSKSKIDSVISELQKDDSFDYRIVSLDNYDIIH
ncbi:MAG TPA: hypothetical protein VLB74_00275 [Flavobacterium sp.]|uniref:hypothetical protein n=1 Tax=Flavobacterium sp. TaxID=239 RepID=UPI002CE6FE29|nr:hypothetical protein [Flavobacterium sp.]HSD13060.1 hypothetical protein [Flavobacterium sp.]